MVKTPLTLVYETPHERSETDILRFGNGLFDPSSDTAGEGSRAYLIPTTIESGPARGSTKALRNPAFFIHDLQSAPV